MRVLKVKIHRPSYYNCVIFAFCFTEILFSTTLETIFGVPTEWLNKMMAYLMLVLLLIQIVFFQKYKRSELIKIVCAGVPFVISALMSKNNSLLCAFLFITAGKDADMDRIVKMLYKLSIIIITAIALLSLTGLYSGEIFRGTLLVLSIQTHWDSVFLSCSPATFISDLTVLNGGIISSRSEVLFFAILSPIHRRQSSCLS